MFIKATFIVINSSRGHQSVFKYPSKLEPNEISLRNLEPIEYKYDDLENEDLSSSSIETKPEEGIQNSYAGLSPGFLGDLFSPKSIMCDKRFQLSFSNWTFIGHPLLLSNRISKESAFEIKEDPQLSQTNFEISMFHLVFALDKNQSSVIYDKFYLDIVKRLSLALKIEQDRCGYLKSEVEKILELTRNNKNGTHDINDLLIESSSLARLLARVYENLCMEKFVQVLVNDRVYLSLKFFTEGVENNAVGLVEPYHSIILLADTETILKSLPSSCSYSLREFLLKQSSRRSLEDLRKKLFWPWEKVKKHVTHLVSYKFAKIILPVSLDNIVCEVCTNILRDGHLLTEWKRKFARFDLISILSTLSCSFQPISSLLGSMDSQFKSLYLDAVEFLLKKQVISQMSTTFYLSYFDPESPNASGRILNPSEPSCEPFIEKMMQKRRDRRSVFTKILNYCDGEYLLDQILLREPKLSRNDILMTVEEYSDYILTHYEVFSVVNR